MTDNQNQRMDFVDLTKGVCIILVVMAHIGGAFDQLDKHSMLSCFRMPLYFFISGIFFKPYEGLSGFTVRERQTVILSTIRVGGKSPVRFSRQYILAGRR